MFYHLLLVVPAVSAIYVGGRSPSRAAPEWWLYRTPLRLFFAGHEAVLIFFVLSGFVLTLPLTRLDGRSWSWAGYYARRLVRLYLPVWGALVFALVLALIVARDPGFGSSWLASHKPPMASALRKDSLLLFGTSNLDSPLWSLRWEMWFSLLLPVMFGVLLMIRARRWWPAAVLALIAASVTSRFPAIAHALPVSWMTAGLLQYLPVFAIGMLFALCRQQVARYGAGISTTRHPGAIWAATTTVALLLTISPSFVGGTGRSYGLTNAVTYAASLVGVVLVLFVALECAGATRLLESRVVQWLGSRSFSIYLVHEPLVVATALSVRADGYLPWLLIAMPLLAVILIVAEAFYRVAERPAQRLSRLAGVFATRRSSGAQVDQDPNSLHLTAASGSAATLLNADGQGFSDSAHRL